MTTTITTMAPSVEVPEDHLTTTIPAARGFLWLYGYRAHDLTARFTLVHEQLWGTERVLLVQFHNVDWPEAYKALHHYVKHEHVEGWLRTVLPPVIYTEA